MIIDFHCHIFPDELAKRAIPAMAAVSGLTPALDGTKSALLSSMRRQGIAYSVLMPVATKPGHVETMNTLALAQNGREGLFSFGAMHVDYEDKKAEFRRLKDGGIQGIKLHFDYMKRFIDAPESVRTINEAFETGLAVLVHAGYDPVSPEIHYSEAARIAAILPQLTSGTLILAHFGGLGQVAEAGRLLAGKDVYLDCSSAYREAPLSDCREVLLRHDPDKLLYGSDSPWFAQSDPLRVLKEMELSEERIEKICWKNAARLLAL
ncbi:MAG: amidohydrolase family protein [Lachnospiraceae bacterium]|nr:amidohydrolase family protein [Lachnospiraceae bacterium]